jgi:hypothetical protein
MDGRAACAGGVATMGRQGEGEGEIACIGSDSDDPGKGRGGAGRSTEALHPPPSLPSVASRRSSRSHGIEGNVPEFRRFLKGVASSSSSSLRARADASSESETTSNNKQGGGTACTALQSAAACVFMDCAFPLIILAPDAPPSSSSPRLH